MAASAPNEGGFTHRNVFDQQNNTKYGGEWV
jgi:hypothetical protein